jgi:hypothetical protein
MVVSQIERRNVSPTLHKAGRWTELADTLSDCFVVLVRKVGRAPL